jgi:general stress protein 26
MSTIPEIGQQQIERFLAAARQTIAEVQHCSLATRSREGGASVRAVRAHAGAPGSDEWTRRILIRLGSRKTEEIRAAPLVTLAFQHDSGDRYVALSGHASLLEDKVQMRSLWSSAMDPYFAPGFADANMILLQIDVDRIEVHARGITGEPFGAGRTLLQRDGSTGWQLIPFQA